MINLRQLRKQVKLTAADVANELGIVESTVRNWEKRRTIPRLRLDQFQKLCLMYGISFEQLCNAYGIEDIEKWGTIAEYPDYVISTKGRIYSHLSNKYILPSRLNTGYYSVRLKTKDGNYAHVSIGNLIATVFLPKPLTNCKAVYIDGNPENYTLSNIKWEINSKVSNMQKSIMQKSPETGEIISTYASAKEAGEHLQLNSEGIRSAIRRGNIFKGYLWEYLENKEDKDASTVENQNL